MEPDFSDILFRQFFWVWCETIFFICHQHLHWIEHESSYVTQISNWSSMTVNNLLPSTEAVVHRCFVKYMFLKLLSAICCQIFIFHQMVVLQKLWKMFFISSKKLFSFSRYSNFCDFSFSRYLNFFIFVFPSFFPCQPLLWSWYKKNLKIYDVINCLNKNLPS